MNNWIKPANQARQGKSANRPAMGLTVAVTVAMASLLGTAAPAAMAEEAKARRRTLRP
ncbi:hypothetical protein Y695_00591 [Hydrogenophaga sp. T4]|nr:hypothetical protein Y695_00591 [Hydrogenophaga sp. T4]